MFNLIFAKGKLNGMYLLNNKSIVYENIDINKYLNRLCLIDGCTLDGKINAMKQITLNSRYKKLPIFISFYNDFLIPLYGNDSELSIWFWANKYLNCFEKNNITYIKFKDGSIIEVEASMYIVKKQVKKHLNITKVFENLRRQLIN